MQNSSREQEGNLRGFKYLEWKIKKQSWFQGSFDNGVLPKQISEFLPMKVGDRSHSPKEEANYVTEVRE